MDFLYKIPSMRAFNSPLSCRINSECIHDRVSPQSAMFLRGSKLHGSTLFSTADAHTAYWCHNSKASECRDLHMGLSSMSSASSPERGRCVPNTSQTVRSRWKRAFPSWSVRFAYTAWELSQTTCFSNEFPWLRNHLPCQHIAGSRSSRTS